jgi:hypothetical protein
VGADKDWKITERDEVIVFTNESTKEEYIFYRNL